MRKAELKEIIRKSILEGDYLEDDPKAMDAMDDAMVADYEEEANKYALDKEEPMEEAMISPDNRVEYLANALSQVWNMGTGNNKIDLHSMAQSLVDDMFDQEPMEESLDDIPDDIKWEVEEVEDRIDAYDAELILTGYSPSTGKTYTGATVGTDVGGGDWEWTKVDIIDVIAEANRIVEAWNAKKQPLKEEIEKSFGQYPLEHLHDEYAKKRTEFIHAVEDSDSSSEIYNMVVETNKAWKDYVTKMKALFQKAHSLNL
jgi:hypothetical protein